MQAFPFLTDLLGTGGVFFVAAAASLVGAIFTFLIVPRTKNKSLYELEILFKKSVDEQIDGGKLETSYQLILNMFQ